MSKDLIIRKNSSEYTRINGVTKVRFETQSGGNADFIPEDEVPSPSLQSKTVTENGVVTADYGYDGLSSVTVSVPTGSGTTVMPSRYMTFGSTYRPILHTSAYIEYDDYPNEILSYHDSFFNWGEYVNEISIFGDGNDNNYSNLEELEIQCDSVSEGAFSNLSNLKEVKLHGLSQIEADCFVNCSLLSNVYFYTSYVILPFDGHQPCFDGSPESPLSLRIHVPESLKSNYINEWSEAFPSSTFVNI